jgi:two-component system alkaline phosphatase synthesis response regulator PhoP
VLVVDDDESARSLMTALIREEAPDAYVRTAADGEEGLGMFLDDPPHVMFIDLDMPRMNGVEVCMYLRATKLAEHTTIVVVSSHAGSNRTTLERLGIADAITKKHADPDRFAAKVHAILARIAMAHELRSRRQ